MKNQFLALAAVVFTIGCREPVRSIRPTADGGVDDSGVVDDRDGGSTSVDAGRDGGMRLASGQIEAVKNAPVGGHLPSLIVDGAIVTDVRPLLGPDPAGFFVQADAVGPALFVSVPDLVPAVGDTVYFEVDETAMRQLQLAVTAVSGYRVVASDFNVTLLLQDVSAVTNLVDDGASYDSELVAFFGKVGTAFTGIGNAQQRIGVGTVGVPNDARFTLRIAEAVIDSKGLVPGCDVTIGPAPLLATPTGIEIFIWSGADLTVTDCDVPFRLVSASASNSTSVTLTFSRPPRASSVMPAAFTVAPGGSVSSVSVSDRRVTLTTAPLMDQTSYTVTVDATVLDGDGQPVEVASNTATFMTGAAPGESLVINEVDYDQPGSDTAEFVELYNGSATAVSLNNLALVFINGNTDAEYLRLDLSPMTSIESGAYIVVKNAAVTVPGGVRTIPIPDTTVQNGAPDGIALVNVQTQEIVDAISYEGRIEAGAIAGFGSSVNLVSGTAATATDNADMSIARLPNGADSGDDDTDWALATPTPGFANVP